MKLKRWFALIIFLVLFITLAASPPSLFNFFAAENEWGETFYRDGGTDRLVLIDIDGVIMSEEEDPSLSTPEYDHNILLDQLDAAFADDYIKGVIIHINSPGGGVADCDEVFQKIRQLKAEYEKPVVAYMGDVAASGAYMIATASDVIYANRHTLTGSIGVILSTYNYYELAENWGIRDESFKSGPYKDILNPMREVSESERVIMQEIIDESYLFLIDSILEERNMERETLLSLSDGRIYSSLQAQNNGLIDKIGVLDDAIEEAEVLSGIENATVIRYRRNDPASISLLLGELKHSLLKLGNLGTKMDLDLIKNRCPSLMYIWNW